MLDTIKESRPVRELDSFIKLSQQEIKAKASIFLNPATGAVWEVFVKEGKLLVDVPNFSFQIAPLSHTRFRPVDTQINLEFEFEESRHNQPLLLHIYAKGINRATFAAL
ncbi:MAG: hypothetical protein JO235_23050 [Chroococcidiopsidaceae cyanobacterium CP_BM_RX_35]|nr:hypothetical protein [Chroococcidiopsidaceae cyanobacterium CP_BM_RX_35]